MIVLAWIFVIGCGVIFILEVSKIFAGEKKETVRLILSAITFSISVFLLSDTIHKTSQTKSMSAERSQVIEMQFSHDTTLQALKRCYTQEFEFEENFRLCVDIVVSRAYLLRSLNQQHGEPSNDED